MSQGKSFLDGFWVLLSTLLGFFGFIIDKLQVDVIMKIFYIFSIYLVMLGIREVYEKRETRKSTTKKEKHKHKNEKESLENINSFIEQEELIKPKAISTINLAYDAEKQAESMVNNINIIKEVSKSMKNRIKDFFVWVWNNKFSLVSMFASILIAGVANFVTLSGWLAENVSFVGDKPILFNILVCAGSVIYLGVDVFTTTSKYGLESCEEIDARLQEIAAAKEAALKPEQKKVLKGYLTTIQKELNKYKGEKEALTKEASGLQTLVDMSLASATQVARLQEIAKLVAEKDALIAKFQKTVDEIAEKLA